MKPQKYIEPGTSLPFRLVARERDLILERALLDPDIDARLRTAPVSGSTVVVRLTLDDVDDLLGCVAAEANHSTNPGERKLFSAVCSRLTHLLETHTDEAPAAVSTGIGLRQPFTEKQGQYLAFIYYYTKLHRRPPAEADLQAYFKVSPPAVHDMILKLERLGFIDRVPGQARSLRLRLARAALPDLL